MNIHIIMHEPFEGPAALEIWAKQQKHTVTYTRLYNNEKLPQNTDQFDFLIIMGGPQSPNTTLEQCNYFDTKQEMSLIKKTIDANKHVLGICLGAQMIGESLGATFEHSPNKEIGVFDVTLTNEAKHDAFFSKFPSRFPVAHWHNDMPGLTKDAKILAISDGCPRQIVRYAPRVYGFQCHFEFTLDAVGNMLDNCNDELNRNKSLPYVQTPQQLKDYDYTSMNQLLFQFLNEFIKQ